jgi:hypothetical protein
MVEKNKKWKITPLTPKEEAGLDKMIQDEIDNPFWPRRWPNPGEAALLGRRTPKDVVTRLAEIIKQNDPEMKHAFTPEAARKFLDKNDHSHDAEKLHQEGYGWKRITVRCACGWEGRRIWRPKMFVKPCPKCKVVFRHGNRQITTLYCPVIKAVKENKS